jgi:hypothetical protein
MPASAFTPAEQKLLRELLARGIRFMIVGMSGALIQGARGSTEDIDLWFEDPRIGGDALSERFDVVLMMSGLGSFASELSNTIIEEVDGIPLPVLSLARIAHSKRVAGRPKDRLALESIDDALAVRSAEKK